MVTGLEHHRSNGQLDRAEGLLARSWVSEVGWLSMSLYGGARLFGGPFESKEDDEGV